MLPTTKIADEFRSYLVSDPGFLFDEWFASVPFEVIGKGRQGAVLIKMDTPGNIPIVRTTTRYTKPAQRFRSIHEQLAEHIQNGAELSCGFNNALIEAYTNAYTTMGAHSDQALDLAEESVIALYSCYEHPELVNSTRKLVVESKERGGENIAIPLMHQSVIVFSVATNRRFKHKIVLDTSAPTRENRWLGITFRTSKTLVHFRDEAVYFPDNTRLTLATDAQKQEFYELRRRENRETNFRYPQITYTISSSDLLPPKPDSAHAIEL